MIHTIPTFKITPNLTSKGWMLKNHTDEIEDDLDKPVNIEFPFSFNAMKSMTAINLNNYLQQ